MDTYELVVPCHFGLEAVTKREIYDLGYEITRVEDGRVTFAGDAEAICRANIFLRSAERVLLQVGRFRATTFDELFEGIKALPWEDYIPKDGKFWVKKASSIKSKLFSPSDIQSIAKKAMVERLKNVYRLNWFPEDGAPYPVRIFLLKDEVMVTLDTSGDSLHKKRNWNISRRKSANSVKKYPLSICIPVCIIEIHTDNGYFHYTSFPIFFTHLLPTAAAINIHINIFTGKHRNKSMVTASGFFMIPPRSVDVTIAAANTT